MTLKAFPFFIFMVFTSLVISAQEVAKDSLNDFSIYLLKQGMYKEALWNIQSNKHSLNDEEQFITGWIYYNQRKLDSSSLFLDRVSPACQLYYNQSRFFIAYNYTYQKKYTKAAQILTEFHPSSALHRALKNFELAGIALLQNDIESFNRLTPSLTGKYYQFAKEETLLKTFANEKSDFRSKSKLLAGLLSAIVPGLGKIYTEHYGGGVSAFLTVGILAALTTENYIKSGPHDAKTWIFGSLFTATYMGNIYGSIYSTNAYQNNFDEKMAYRIRFHLHIPLRTVFE